MAKLPVKKDRVASTFRVDAELLVLVKRYAKARDDTLQEAIDYGMQRYVEACQAEGIQLQLFSAPEET